MAERIVELAIHILANRLVADRYCCMELARILAAVVDRRDSVGKQVVPFLVQLEHFAPKHGEHSCSAPVGLWKHNRKAQ